MIDVQRGTITEEHTCRGCGRYGRVALVASADDGRPPLALCRDCAHDRDRLVALIHRLGLPRLADN